MDIERQLILEDNRNVGYLTDDNGNKSEVRVMSVFAFIAAIFTQVFIFFKPPEDYFIGIYIFTAWLIAAFAPKVIQKFAEILPLLIKK